MTKFAALTVWDSVLFRRRFGRNIEALAMTDAEAESAGLSGNELAAFKQDGILFLGWRAAVAGGFAGAEDEFWASIPMSDMASVLEEAAGFFGARPASEPSLD